MDEWHVLQKLLALTHMQSLSKARQNVEQGVAEGWVGV